MNLRIRRSVTNGSPVADVAREVKKRCPCLLSAHDGGNRNGPIDFPS